MKNANQNLIPFNSCAFILSILLFCSCKKEAFNEIPLSSQQSSATNAATKPNIILILGDDIGYEVPTYTGGQSYTTTNIDNLAQSGQQFAQCQAAPDCSPSRVMLMTGKYNFRNYVQWGILDTTQFTIGNLMHNAGYKTCVAGKWQLDGGDASAKKFGFDNYLLFLPFFVTNENAENKYRYKNPHLYENGAFLPDSVTNGQYADDMFVNYISNFIDSNLHNPFFVYYPMSLCHTPFSPTPDDADYATWDPSKGKSNTKYFPSMVAYMDKEVKKIQDKLQATGLSQNTIVIYFGDNGTPDQITSKFRGGLVQGGKGTTTQFGTHVPFIYYWQGHSLTGAVNTNLIDFTDMMFTLADIAGTTVPVQFGPYDGVSFYSALLNNSAPGRTSVFCHWQPKTISGLHRWAQTTQYKLYDTTDRSRFFDIINDSLELNPLRNKNLTSQQRAVKQQLQNVINQMHD